MCDQLDRLQRDYRAMLLHGIVPTGLLIDQQTLSAIASDSLRSDPRLEWGEDGLDRLFGFRPQIAEGETTRFTCPSHPAELRRRPEHFTLGELRAL